MNELVASEMKRLRELMDRIRSKPLREQLALIRAHVSTTEQQAKHGEL
jgi:hypothetical protein